MVFEIHVAYDVVAKVSHDQMILFVVHVDYVDIPEVYHDQTSFFVVYVDCRRVFLGLTSRFQAIRIKSKTMKKSHNF